MKIPLSDRLLACCNYVNRGDRVADVGCDHGYLGIYLLTNGIAKSVIESDVAEGPLQSAIPCQAHCMIGKRVKLSSLVCHLSTDCPVSPTTDPSL